MIIKFFLVSILFFPALVLASDSNLKKNLPEPKTEAHKMKMTIPEAKELCKKEGKSGDDLIKCIEEKQKP